MTLRNEPTIRDVDFMVCRIPTDEPESDGTLQWDHTDVVIAHVRAGDQVGLGWSYASPAAAAMAAGILKPAVVGISAFSIEHIWQGMNHCLRNAGLSGPGLMAVSAIDVALWDVKAKILEIPLVDLFGPVRSSVPIYGSGGFTSYSPQKLGKQLSAWVKDGIPRVKMKVGREPGADVDRVRSARRAIGDSAELFVDANGAYTPKQALLMAQLFYENSHVTWFEEPRPSDDLAGLRLLRDRGNVGVDISAGEYGDTPLYFRRMLEAGAVDCLQADVTRCGGYSGFLKVAAICDAFQMPLSAHCAPQLHAHVGCAVQCLRHVEYFHDHVRIGHLLFDGMLKPRKGGLEPDRSRPGHGMRLKSGEAEKYRI